MPGPHGGESAPLPAALAEILARAELRQSSWSVRIRHVGASEVAAEHDPHRRMRTASVGKLLLLVEVATRLTEGSLSPTALLARGSVDPVADSGLWQHLDAVELSVADAATLVGSVSDNLATNVLLAEVGVDAVAARAERLGLTRSRLHDLVRSHRTADHPATLSEGSAAEWCDLMAGLHARTAAPRDVCDQVLAWLSACADHSMVAGALDLDPLSHGVDPHARPRLWSKTGTDDGVRADTGVMADGEAAIAYAALCSWDPQGPIAVRQVLRAMRDIGAACLEDLDRARSRSSRPANGGSAQSALHSGR